jgi:hypothetical protein
MRRGTLIALLCMAAVAAASVNSKGNRQYMESSESQELDQFSQGRQQATPFRAGNEYTFTYNAQIATGMVAPDTSEDPGMPQQKATTRLQAKATIQFSSERHGSLQLQDIRLGELNDQIPEPDRVKPMRIFEPKQIPEEKRRRLQLPAQFTYVDGVVERIQFHTQDDTWCKNIKRAVLNMIQLNLKKNNCQGLRLPEELSGENRRDQNNENDDDWRSESENSKSFTLPEITIEGECQAMYTVQEPNEREGSGRQQFNVTKSINFKQCRKIADVAYGYQTQQVQPQCVQCQQLWYNQQQKRPSPDDQDREQRNQRFGPCEQQCDPKEVKEQKFSRSTVQRCVLQGDQEKYGVKRCEVTSQYVYKNLNAETGQYGSAMHAIAVSELVFLGVQQKSQPSGPQQRETSDQDETLLFSNQQDVDEKRFYMYGDEEYARNSPFKDVQNKVQQAEQSLQKLIQTATNQDHGIEIEAPIQLQRLVETLRMCDMQELKQIDQATSSRHSASGSQSEKKEMANQFFADALAMAGTRNTIALLVEKILENDISASKAAQTLRSLQGLPAPSDSQVKMVERLCHSEQCQRSDALKQACWLTFGNMINELCQHKTQRIAQQSIVGAQSGFDREEVCPLEKKEKYRKELVQKFQNAQSTYQKVLALKALGNAGIPQTIPDLEQIIKDQNEERIVRIVAVDALRRLRVQMPNKIQRILMPVFLDNREQPELRMAAFSQLMNTLPSKKVIDQIVYALTKERSKHVLAFAYNTMKSIANTKNPIHKEMVSKHIQNALKLLNVDDKTLKMAGRVQIPIYSQEQQEGVFVNLYSASSPRSQLPVHISARLNSVLNNEYQTNDLQVGISQQNMDEWVEQLLRAFNEQSFFSQKSGMTRGQRQQSHQSQSLRDIYNALGIKNRRSSQYNNKENNRDYDEQPFAMLNLRIGDVDQTIITINGGENDGAPQRLLKAVLNGNQKPSLSQILAVLANSNLNGNHHQVRRAMATNLNEKIACIPTSCGLLLKAQQSVPIIAVVEAQAQLNTESSSLKAQVQARLSMNVAHIQKLECQLPIFATGAQSIRSLELNAPINAEVSMSGSHGLQIRIKVPQSNQKPTMQVLGLHTLPTTYVTEFDQFKKTLREPRIKAIHNENIEQYQREVNTVVGRAAGLPFHVKGHFYRPSKLTNYKQMVQMLMAGENQIHVEFRPNQKTPREVVLRIESSHFERTQSESPKFDDFYSQMKLDFDDELYEQDFENMESHKERSQKLNKYLGNQYQSGQMYKHALKMSAQCVGGQSDCKAQMEIQSTCDSRFKYCKMNLNADRTPLNDESGSKWTLRAQAQILRPDTVNSANQLDELNQRNRRFIARAECEWGQSSSEKQHLNVRIQAEQAMKKQWRKIEQYQSRRYGNKADIMRRINFLNKFDLSADYKLKPSTQDVFRRVFEIIKADNFFNTRSVQLNNNGQQKEGHVRATVVIDPISQRHCNATVQTPSQTVRIESIELPMQCRPFALIRSSVSDKPTHSVQQLFSRWAVGGRAECTADGRRVNTFDNVEYKAPIGKCFSVLAKDCSSDEPQFVVMMKALGKNGGNQGKKDQKEQLKKIKVITPEQTVECQPKDKSSSKSKLSCKVNGREQENLWNGNDQEYNEEGRSTVEYNNDKQTDVTINVRGVSVRFNGRKAWIKIAKQFKNAQCGLCGHYNDDSEDEWRMSNDERTDDLSKFHRSYSLFGQDNECTAEEQQEFYQQRMFSNGKNIGRTSSSSSSESDEQDDDDDESNDWEDFNGQDREENFWSSRSNRNDNYGRRDYNRRSKQNPVHQTAVMEAGSTKICFSMEPVQQCPRGTFDTENGWDSDDFGYGSDEQLEKKNKRKNGSKGQQKDEKTVKFACLNRSTPEARELLRQARRGEVLDMSGHRASLTETVAQATGKCVLY